MLLLPVGLIIVALFFLVPLKRIMHHYNYSKTQLHMHWCRPGKVLNSVECLRWTFINI